MVLVGVCVSLLPYLQLNTVARPGYETILVRLLI
jgi:hypothetical protein